MMDRNPIAVVGMGGVFPGAPHLDAFWQNILHGVDAIREVPDGRWSVPKEKVVDPRPLPDKALSMRAGLVDPFPPDPEAWGIDPALAAALDPLYHLVLRAGRAAFSDAAGNAGLDRSRTGVILAAIALPTDASSRVAMEILGVDLPERWFQADPGAGAGAGPASRFSRNRCLAARVTSLPGALLARSLGLGGGSYTLDAACASSLYAVKLACDALSSGRLDAVLAGGVSRPDCLYTQIGFSQLRALSPTGRCAPFDAGADGLVVGEGAGILMMKRLADALKHGDRIYGLIRGIGLSNDMRGNLLAPDTEGQVRAMRAAYAAAGWSPSEVAHIECHGAGTPLGDRTELASLRELWKGTRWSRGMCAIGSIKSMIGHLLTAAGAAGMIKTLLAMRHGTLPPSLHFTRPAANSPLAGGPFRVQTEAAPWEVREPDLPRRAAVSAFGFGGINAHLLFEEFHPGPDAPAFSGPPATPEAAPRPEAIAIVGMAVHMGPLPSLQAFQEAVFNGRPAIRKRPPARFRGADAAAGAHLDGRGAFGAYLESLAVEIGAFRIPPSEIPDILPQQLLMLITAKAAMEDARVAVGGELPRAGTAIGMEFDLEDTDFHVRWQVIDRREQHRLALRRLAPEIDDARAAEWLETLPDIASPPLTAPRVVGSLGGIVASRVAREFRFGGPSHVVSCGAASGLHALEIGVRSLQQGETDLFLAGAVDLTGDVRNMVIESGLRPFGTGEEVRPFDRGAGGPLPGEGAVALVLKRLDAAEADGDRIYAVVTGVGSASGGDAEDPAGMGKACAAALGRALADAGISADAVGYVEAHGSGDPREDALEAEALHAVFPAGKNRPAVGSLKAVTGDAGAAAGLASVVKAALCLYHEILPPLPGFREPGHDLWHEERFHIPVAPQFWIRDRKEGPRRAVVSSLTLDGNAAHAVLEGRDAPRAAGAASERIARERRRPLGLEAAGLFVVEGDTPEALLDGLARLRRHAAEGTTPLEAAAMAWHRRRPAGAATPPRAVAVVARDPEGLRHWIGEAERVVRSSTPRKIVGPGGVSFFPEPLGPRGRIAFVYPGSGNHYVGMGRGVGVRWPGVLREMDRETEALKTQMFPECYVPFRISWEDGWEEAALRKIVSDPHYMIFGQVVHGGLMTGLAGRFGVRPDAVIGYSLGESAGLFATGAWPERGRMLHRMQHTGLFKTDLAGPCNAARAAWSLPPEQPVDWRVAVVNRPAREVREVLPRWPLARLLIVNTPRECVIGGHGPHVAGVIRTLACDAIHLEGVVTVHCDAALPVAEAYRELHRFPTTPPPGIRYYSCALGRSYLPTEASAADAILAQALHGFDFPATIEQAYEDGIRLFLEMGPQGSCRRMIGRILAGRPHSALSICARGEDDYLTVLKFLGTLAAERVAVDLESLYGEAAYPEAPQAVRAAGDRSAPTIRRVIGGEPLTPPPRPRLREPLPEPPLPPEVEGEPAPHSRPVPPQPEIPQVAPAAPTPPPRAIPPAPMAGPETAAAEPSWPRQFTRLLSAMNETVAATAEAHRAFLDFSDELTRNYGRSVAIQARLLEGMAALPGGAGTLPAPFPAGETAPEASLGPPPAFSREMCMEFAVGSAARVLGPEFAEVDTYPVRVRLPAPPLMLVDRILSVEGKKGGMDRGRVITEHDVLPGAWYLDGERAPTCISVEAGQADLFLSGYLGIDLQVKGKRAYRLLDAKATFHRGLPRPGEVIRYDIHIDKFVRQGETYMFFFRFEGHIGDEHLITMRDGCAGFFTEAEVRNSGGILLRPEETERRPGRRDFTELVPMAVESYDDDALDALRRGDLEACFGEPFAGVTAPAGLRLPGGPMRLVHRVARLDPAGGRCGMGIIRAEADIRPDDWFLTCHFPDDMVMPGTLMYECCMHTLRIFLQRMGWVSEAPDAGYEPVVGRESILRCRGPVTPATRKVVYEVEIREIGYGPEPYALADAMMYADGRPIVRFEQLSMKLSGARRSEIEAFWEGRRRPPAPVPVVFSREQLLAFCTGNPSEAFGEPYRVFDRERRIARLPRPPYLFMDRVTRSDPAPWVLAPGGWIEAEYAIPPDAWYFRADRSGVMPFCILLEIALQPCGWLAAYMGSALKSDQDLKFRNLGGEAVLHRNLPMGAGRLTMRTRLTQSSSAGGMIIEHFEMAVLWEGRPVYTGTTYFGFFTEAALAQQAGIPGAGALACQPTLEEISTGESHTFDRERPLSPEDPGSDAAPSLAFPATALRMIDTIELWVPDGGPRGLGFIRGAKTIDPEEWFFAAHFYQDPVCPGSLGIESFLQLIKFAALRRWPHLRETHRFETVTDEAHRWSYRGQILRTHRRIEVDAVITRVIEGDAPALFADGFLKVDGRFIYRMEHFGVRLSPAR